ncbi:Bgt-154 [Blumeria graminis f. sp. tritici]|uniref:Ubiquitin carboxyl-terminal hydrolase n=2 Tax=Blumeria graminis f. sp. tritici TaxID=62690 RepID=A0A381LHJ8_BLUGR|nr:Ubiquitin C-terminal hydrolase [Blumeria graminis f. sp. tritici 96224]VCU38790.1 Bgt-154 [Blumeria graminis f. sp. tritici]
MENPLDARVDSSLCLTAENSDVPPVQKSFVPLENNPEVMSKLAHSLGLSNAFSFHDIFSIDEPEMLEFYSRPVTALLLVFPISKCYEEFRKHEDQTQHDYDLMGDQEAVIWYKQTIRNACGLIGILHAVSNGEARNFIESDSDLERFLKEAIPQGPDHRANLIYNFKPFETAHEEAANHGQSDKPNAEDDTDLHYVCFVKDKDNVLWELDGRRKGPLNRGQLLPNEDLLSEKALDLSVRSFTRREVAAGQGELRFSLISLAPA